MEIMEAFAFFITIFFFYFFSLLHQPVLINLYISTVNPTLPLFSCINS